MSKGKDIIDAIADLLDLLKPILGDWLVDSELDRRLKEIAPRIQTELEWSGEKGYLVEVPVAEHPSTGQLGMGELVDHGAAATRGEALAGSISRDTIRAAYPVYHSQERSFYVWYDREKKEWQQTTYPFTEGLRNEALLFVNDRTVLGAMKKRQKDRVFDNALRVLETKVRDDDARANVLRIKSQIEENRKRLAQIEAELKRSLEKAERIEKFLAKVQKLQALLSVADMVAEAKSSFPEAGIDETNTPDYETLEKHVRTREAYVDGVIIRERTEVDVIRRQQTDLENKGGALLQENGAPSIIWR